MIVVSKSGSKGLSLHFHSREEEAVYDAECHEAAMKHYHKEVQEHGYFAENQNEYVESVKDFGPWDSLTMYNWYQEWLNK